MGEFMRKMKYAAAAVLTAALLAGCGGSDQAQVTDQAQGAVVSSSQDADGYVYQKRSEVVYAVGDVNIREAATSQSEIVGVLAEGQSITRTAWNSSWSKVIFDNKICYIASAYLTTDEPQEPTKAPETEAAETESPEETVQEESTAAESTEGTTAEPSSEHTRSAAAGSSESGSTAESKETAGHTTASSETSASSKAAGRAK